MAQETRKTSNPCTDCKDEGLGMLACDHCKLKHIYDEIVESEQIEETFLLTQYFESLASHEAPDLSY